MAQILSIASDNWSTKKAAFNITGSHACCLEHPDPKVIWKILSKSLQPVRHVTRIEESLQLYFWHLFRFFNNKTKVLRHRNRLVARVSEIRLCSQPTIILYYIDTDEIPGFFPFTKKKKYLHRAQCRYYCEDIGVAMVTNINFDFLEQKI